MSGSDLGLHFLRAMGLVFQGIVLDLEGTLNPKPQTLNPKPQTLNPGSPMKEKIIDMMSMDKVVAWGECGLDYFETWHESCERFRV